MTCDLVSLGVYSFVFLISFPFSTDSCAGFVPYFSTALLLRFWDVLLFSSKFADAEDDVLCEGRAPYITHELSSIYIIHAIAFL